MPTPPCILIIESNESLREILYEAMQLYGYQAVTAPTLQEAETLKQRLGPEGIDLVILEINLTAVIDAREGYALFERWTALHPHLPFILIGSDPRSRELPAIRKGLVRFLLKPFSIDALLEAIRSSLEE